MRNTFFFFCLCFLFFACDKAEKIPAYIKVKPFVLNTDYPTQGANSQKITEAWVYANDNLLGAFKPNSEIPILEEGDVKITILAGVRDNGSSDRPNFYYHYAPYEITKKLVSGQTDSITPVITYAKGLNFRWLEDFEGSVNTLNTDADKDKVTNATLTTTDVKYGNRCLLLKVNKDHQIIQVAPPKPFDKLPSNRIYIEMDYKGDIPMVVEFHGLGNNGLEYIDAATYRERSDWNKAYINFTAKLDSKYTSYALIFSTYLPVNANGTPAKDAGEVRIDNIKLIHP